MMDMMSEDPIAEYILDAVTEQSVCRAVSYARAGADFLFLGVDILNPVQPETMDFREIYREFGG